MNIYERLTKWNPICGVEIHRESEYDHQKKAYTGKIIWKCYLDAHRYYDNFTFSFLGQGETPKKALENALKEAEGGEKV